MCGKGYHFVNGRGSDKTNLFIVSESPVTTISLSEAGQGHVGWGSVGSDTIEAYVRKTVDSVRKNIGLEDRVSAYYTYVVKCKVPKVKQAMVESCFPLLWEDITSRANKAYPVIIYGLGKLVLKTFDIKVTKYTEALGVFHSVEKDGWTINILAGPTVKQLKASSGYRDIMRNQVYSVLRVTSDIMLHKIKAPMRAKHIDSLSKNYIFPKTPQEVQSLVEYVLAYNIPGTTEVGDHPIAIDTETNSLYPYKKDFKIQTITLAWGRGKAASIALEHKETPYKLEEIRSSIVLLLTSTNRKIMQNAKFDLQVLQAKNFVVNNLSWDTQIAEHLLAEDKKGEYSLKSLTRTFIPEYADYEKDLVSKVDLVRKRMAASWDADLGKTHSKKSPIHDFYMDGMYAEMSLEDLHKYGAVDSDVTFQMAVIQRKRMTEEQKDLNVARRKLARDPSTRKIAGTVCNDRNPLPQIMKNISVPLSKTLARMEATGFRVDLEYAKNLLDKVQQRKHKTDTQIKLMLPGYDNDNFNVQSDAQIAKVLFNIGYINPNDSKLTSYEQLLKTPGLISKTPTGLISIDNKLLDYLVREYNCSFAKEIHTYRKLKKAADTYIQNIIDRASIDGSMHAQFNIDGTATGRLSASKENMQNVPHTIMNEYNIKKCFIPHNPVEYTLIDADAKAAEVRIYAGYSKDKNLIDALNNGLDPHSYIASKVYNVATVLRNVSDPVERKHALDVIGIDEEHAWSYDDFEGAKRVKDKAYGKRLTKLRKISKRVVFGILYGSSPGGIANTVGISQQQGAAIIDVLFTEFPSIPKYVSNTGLQIQKLGVVETYYGRRRRINMKGLPYSLQNRGKRQAINFKIQSTSSDIITQVLVDVEEVIRNDMRGAMLITVHDSLVFEIPKEYIPQISDVIYKYGTEKVASMNPWLPVPFKWDIQAGDNYGELKDLQEYLDKVNAKN